MTIAVRKANTFLSVTFPYDANLVEVMSAIPGAEYEKKHGRWKVPLSVDLVDRMLSEFERLQPPPSGDEDWSSMSAAMSSVRDSAIAVDEKTVDWMEAAKARHERIRKVRAMNDPDLGIEWVDGFTPFHFQKKGALFMAVAKRALLGDKMGLGKTVETMMAVAVLRKVGIMDPASDRILIVAPNKGREAWVRHVQWLFPGDHTAMIGVGKGMDNRLAPGWYVINWEKVAHRVDKLTKVDWACIVADESHRMKEKSTATAKAMHKLDSQIKLALTGTPIKNRREELWSQLHWLDKGRFPAFWTFVRSFAQTETKGGPGREWEGPRARIEIVGEKNDDLLVRELETIMLARDVDDPEVDMDLPEVFVQDDPVLLGPGQWAVYEQMRDEFVAWLEGEDDAIVAKNWMTQALRLKQIAVSLAAFSENHRDSAKIDRLMERIEDAPDEKFVVMSQFRTAGVDPLTWELRRRGIPYCEMVGGGRNVAWTMRAGERPAKSPQQLMDYFNLDEVPRVFTATTQTGGESITLTGARHFDFLDEMWAPTDNEQAWKRIHRGGQTRTCFVNRIRALETVDYMLIDPMLRRKEDIIRRVMKPGQN